MFIYSYFCSWKIRELLQEFPGTSEIEPNEIYSIPLTVGPYSCTLIVNLPGPQPGPQNVPLLFCDPVIPKHPMIDSDGQVKLEIGMGSDGDLVGIVRRIIQFSTIGNTGNTPNTSNTLNTGNNTLYHASNSLNSNSNLNISVNSLNVPSSSTNETFSPVVNLSNGFQMDVSLISSLTEEQVNHLLNDEEKFKKFMSNFQSVLDEQENFIYEMKCESIEKARANIELKKEIDHLGKRLDDLNEKYSQTCQSYKNFMALNASALASLSPENILTEIQVNLMELNDFTNNAIKSALSSENYSNLDLELKECVKMRKDYHKKAILLQKYQE